MDAARWVALAEVARPHGVRGELRVKVYNSDSDLLTSIGQVLVRRAEGQEAHMDVESVRGADSGYLLVKLRGVNDRDQAEGLRGAALCVRRDAFPPADEGEFYVCDILGARVMGSGGEVGVVQDFVSYPSSEVLVVVARGGVERVELPLLEGYIDRVDVEAGQVVLGEAGLELVLASAAKGPNAN